MNKKPDLTQIMNLTESDFVLEEESSPETTLRSLQDMLKAYGPTNEHVGKTTYVPQEELLKEFRKTTEWEEPKLSLLANSSLRDSTDIKFQDMGVESLLEDLASVFETTKNLVFFIHLLQKVLGQSAPESDSYGHTLTFKWQIESRSITFYIGPTFEIACDGPLSPIRPGTRVPVLGWPQIRPYFKWLLNKPLDNDSLKGFNIFKK